MKDSPRDLARRLAEQVEAVCHHYLSHGRRQGNYWQVGDVRNTPGRSMFVRLRDKAKGPAGKWTDAATGEHGDLLDVIRETCGLVDFADLVHEARAFLSLPHPDPEQVPSRQKSTPAPSGSSEAARRLFAMSPPISDTIVEAYLRNRGITTLHETGSLRFHPHCYYRPDEHSPTEIWPAMIAAVTDLEGRITGAHRTWLDPNGFDTVRLGKAPIDTQRKAMGSLLGHAVRFGAADDVLAVGEGIETMLSLRCALPAMPMAAALSANHLAALLFPPALRRLYIARDADAAGDTALATLTERAEAAGIEALALSPRRGDFNEDLRAVGLRALRAGLRTQLAPRDVVYSNAEERPRLGDRWWVRPSTRRCVAPIRRPTEKRCRQCWEDAALQPTNHVKVEGDNAATDLMVALARPYRSPPRGERNSEPKANQGSPTPKGTER